MNGKHDMSMKRNTRQALCMQRIVDFAKRHFKRVTFSRARQCMYMSDGTHGYQSFARLYKEDGDLWVNFDFPCMSGNDPVLEFEHTLKQLINNPL
jgi:hypothetical protein